MNTVEETKKIIKKDNKKEEVAKKKSDKIPTKKDDNKSIEDITATQIAREYKMTPQALRKILRANFTKPEDGWKWNKDSKEYKEVINTLENKICAKKK